MIYRWGVIASLVTAVTMLIGSSVYAESGVFIVGDDTLNVRSEPRVSASQVASYSSGEMIAYDSIVTGDGYRWVSYVGVSGNRNYVAIGKIDGSETYGTLKGSSEGASVDSSQLVGEWHNAQGETIKNLYSQCHQ